ncbi:RIP metalloprotease RseP [Nibricoccus aquaticus]|uniref:Zinc metalloprotease n=1 Tax=Nibricoccus aquaticus TaxID=2576891 RepID=A0A290QBJ4_9BACT|nr:RIP metalloprotease RseP [Nibricoccus aquaticus]ATC65894.1 RIP metalloprotease RseP [Nibricoccus aquaticus]
MDFQSLFSNAWSLVLVVIFFGGSIFVHELGHFLAARRRGLKVERFSIGFGPPIYSWTGKDGVEYRLSWIPLGGYVALPQLADLRQLEGTSEVSEAEKASIPYSAKVEVLVAGAVFNILFALILACIIWVTGYPVTKSDLSTRVGYVATTVNLDGKDVPSPAAVAGLKAGDLILQIDDHRTERWRDVPQSVVLGSGRDAAGNPEATLIVQRDGQELTLVTHPLLIGDVDKMRTLGIAPADDLSITDVLPASPAAAAGLQPGDTVTSFNGIPVYSIGHIHELVQANRDQPITLGVKRGATTTTIQVTPRLETIKAGEGENAQEQSLWRMGIRWADQRVLIKDAPFRMIGEHFVQMWRTVGALTNRHSDVGISKMNGPVGIGRGFHQMAQIDWRLLLWFTILVNVNLALMNLLPIPVLDGGHILFATIARLRGRALPAEFMAKMTTAFFLVLISMILYVTTFDVRRWISDSRDPEPPAKPAPTAPAEPAPAKP